MRRHEIPHEARPWLVKALSLQASEGTLQMYHTSDPLMIIKPGSGKVLTKCWMQNKIVLPLFTQPLTSAWSVTCEAVRSFKEKTPLQCPHLIDCICSLEVITLLWMCLLSLCTCSARPSLLESDEQFVVCRSAKNRKICLVIWGKDLFRNICSQTGSNSHGLSLCLFK